MLTKIVAALLLTGALAVAGDAALERIGCCFPGSDCCPSGDCCSYVAPAKTTPTESTCCSNQTSCRAKSAVSTPCCEGGLVYCTQADVFSLGSCCAVENGQYRCLLTGTVSDECCCIPVE